MDERESVGRLPALYDVCVFVCVCYMTHAINDLFRN